MVITASHNGAEWCGLKFIGPTSVFLTPDECKLVYSDLQEVPMEDIDTKDIMKDKNVVVTDN